MCSVHLLQDSLLVVGCGMGRTAGFSIVVAGAKGRAVVSAGLLEREETGTGWVVVKSASVCPGAVVGVVVAAAVAVG